MPEAEDLEAELRSFLRDNLALSEDFGRDDELLSMGLISSVELVQLAGFVEERTGLEIPDRDIAARYFDSIGRILDYVALRRRS